MGKERSQINSRLETGVHGPYLYSFFKQSIFVVNTFILGFMNCFLPSQGHPECPFLKNFSCIA